MRWVAVRHAADHIHLVAMLARQDGRRPILWHDFFRVREACQAAERRYGLRATASADRTAARRPSRGENEKAARKRWAEPARVTLRRKVGTAAAAAADESRLQHAGVLVRTRLSTRTPGQITGYAVALPADTTSVGGPVWYSGGKLAPDLTLPKLRHRWHDPTASTPPAAGSPGPNATPSGTTPLTPPQPPQATSATWPPPTQKRRPTPRGPPPVRCTLRRRSWAVARSAGPPTPTTAPPARPTAASPGPPGPAAACAIPPGCCSPPLCMASCGGVRRRTRWGRRGRDGPAGGRRHREDEPGRRWLERPGGGLAVDEVAGRRDLGRRACVPGRQGRLQHQPPLFRGRLRGILPA